jgi:hypothetical protein
MAASVIFCLGATEADRAVLATAPKEHGAQVVDVSPAGLAQRVLGAVARGPVICIVEGDRDAGNALGLGVDEVLRTGEVSPQALADALARARARAAVRASKEYRHALLDQDDDAAFGMLGGALGERLETPLAMAAVDCAAVAEAMNCLIEIDDQFVAWTALVAPSDQLRSRKASCAGSARPSFGPSLSSGSCATSRSRAKAATPSPSRPS